jgi:mono/diheme cytochrome c family protein
MRGTARIAAVASLMRGTAGSAAVALVAVILTAACEKHEYEPPDRAQRVEEAATLLTPEMFDTITWSSVEDRAFAGNNVYAARCRSCHGYLGEAGTDYARESDLEVPSLVRPEWPYADIETVRRVIFTGHPGGMPTWGVAGITPREIDAVAYYIVYVLRPEAARLRRIP